MNETIYKESYRQLLGSMANIAIMMPEIISLYYFDKLGDKNKYLLCLFNESYKTTLMICESLKNACISQAAVLLRLLLESTSIIHLLKENPNLLDEYIKHYRIRLKIGSSPEKEWNILKEEFPNIPSNKQLKFMDYGWFKSVLQPIEKNGKTIIPEPSETELIRLAGFNDIILWKKLFFDKFSHQAYLGENFIDKKGEFPIVINLIQILCKLFDSICCDFHALTGFDFVINGEDMFHGVFRKIYKNEDFK